LGETENSRDSRRCRVVLKRSTSKNQKGEMGRGGRRFGKEINKTGGKVGTWGSRFRLQLYGFRKISRGGGCGDRRRTRPRLGATLTIM